MKPKSHTPKLSMGRLTGIEPATLGTTIRCSNQLSYNRHPRLSVSEEKIELSSQQASPQTNRSSWTSALRRHSLY